MVLVDTNVLIDVLEDDPVRLIGLSSSSALNPGYMNW